MTKAQLLISVGLFFLAGCASVPLGNTYSPENLPKLTAGQNQIIVFRTHSGAANRQTLPISIADQECALADGAFLVVSSRNKSANITVNGEYIETINLDQRRTFLSVARNKPIYDQYGFAGGIGGIAGVLAVAATDQGKYDRAISEWKKYSIHKLERQEAEKYLTTTKEAICNL